MRPARHAESASAAGRTAARGRQRLLRALEALLAIEPMDLRAALEQAAPLLAEALGASEVTGLMYEPLTDALGVVARWAPASGPREGALPARPSMVVAGPAATVFRTGAPYLGRPTVAAPQEHTEALVAAPDPAMIVPVVVGARRRAVLRALPRSAFFSEDDLRFVEAAAEWIGAVAHQAELAERVAEEATLADQRVAAADLLVAAARELSGSLTPLRARLDLMAGRAARENRSRDLHDAGAALAAIDRLQRLEANLLDVARLERDVFAIEPRPTDLAALVRETIPVVEAPRNPVVPRTPERLVVTLDPERIRQALTNMLADAARRSPHGAAIAVEVTTQERMDGPWAVVVVEDQGPELAPEILRRISAGLVGGRGGIGLALHLAARIAAGHGGALTALSSSRGTRLLLWLPLGVTP